MNKPPKECLKVMKIKNVNSHYSHGHACDYLNWIVSKYQTFPAIGGGA